MKLPLCFCNTRRWRKARVSAIQFLKFHFVCTIEIRVRSVHATGSKEKVHAVSSWNKRDALAFLKLPDIFNVLRCISLNYVRALLHPAALFHPPSCELCVTRLASLGLLICVMREASSFPPKSFGVATDRLYRSQKSFIYLDSIDSRARAL